MHRFCPRLVHFLSLSLSRSVSFPLPRCLKLEFQVSRSEIRFDDSTWSGAEGGIRNRSRARGLVAERASEREKEGGREKEREEEGEKTWNVARNWRIKTERWGKREGEDLEGGRRG